MSPVPPKQDTTRAGEMPPPVSPKQDTIGAGQIPPPQSRKSGGNLSHINGLAQQILASISKYNPVPQLEQELLNAQS